VSAGVDASIEAAADALWRAHEEGRVTPAPSHSMPDLDLDGAYAIQRALVARHEAAGATPIGWKVGMVGAVGRDAATPGPIYGRLLSGMVVPDGGRLERAALHDPFVEGEIAFVLERDLRGPAVGEADVLAATAGVRPAIEVFARRLDAPTTDVRDLVADNAQCAHVVLGPELAPLAGRELRQTGMVITRDETIVGTGAGAQVLGDPARSVAWLANALAAHGQGLRAGDVVITGAVAGAHAPRARETYTVELDRVGRVSVGFA
jgi:2-keto-4-pentenoate hydratase